MEIFDNRVKYGICNMQPGEEKIIPLSNWKNKDFARNAAYTTATHKGWKVKTSIKDNNLYIWRLS